MRAYRALARDLASAREIAPGGTAAAALESAYAALHAAVGRSPRIDRRRLLALVRDDLPAAAARVRSKALWLGLLLVASAFAGWWLIEAYPELVSLIASERMIDGVEQGRVWTDQLLNVAPSSILSARIFSNNAVVAAAAFSSGLLFGLGTFYMVALNGLMIGGLLAFTHEHGLGLELLKFTLAHGPVELSVICLAGAAGTALAESVIRPTAATRSESLRRSVAELAPLLGACVALLVGSGLIEGFVSADPRVTIPTRLAVGLGYFALMLLLLGGRLIPRARVTRTVRIRPDD